MSEAQDNTSDRGEQEEMTRRVSMGNWKSR